MPVIDLCKVFGNQLVEGIDKVELLKLLRYEDSKDFELHNGVITHVPSGKKVVLGCAGECFRPRDDYYRLGKNDRCSFVQRALGVSCAENNCVSCYRQCLEHGLEIRSKKVRVAKDYFIK